MGQDIVDFESTDSTLEWVLSHCRIAIEEGLLRVYSADGAMPYWHAPMAKNTVHMLASEDVLVNLDCDNLIGKGVLDNVAK